MPESERKIDDSFIGFRNLIGLEAKELSDGFALMELTIGPQHLNSGGSLHGGVLATMIDHTGGIAGCFCTKTGRGKKAVTLSLTTSFLAGAAGGKVTAIGRKRPGGKRIFVSTVEVTDESGRLLAIGEATYRYIEDKEQTRAEFTAESG
jgi:uncharacterized protein (TIGR00369 family)